MDYRPLRPQTTKAMESVNIPKRPTQPKVKISIKTYFLSVKVKIISVLIIPIFKTAMQAYVIVGIGH